MQYNMLAYFVDQKDCLQKAVININEACITIDTYDQDENQTGYTCLHFQQDHKIFLEVIYCLDEYRGYGIASYINELTEYLLKDLEGYVIRGNYHPCQLSTDRENHIERSNEELDLRAKAFYNSAGYEIVNYHEFMNNKEKYPYLEENDFLLGEEEPGTIVAKPIIKKSHNFFEQDGVIYYDLNKMEKRTSRLNIIEIDKSKYVKVMIGSGDSAIATYKRRGEKYLLSDGTIVRAGYTKEESRRRIEDRLDEIIYSKPIALVKKIKRRLKNR